MAQNRAFSLGGIGSPCCCAPGCNTTICVQAVACGTTVNVPHVDVTIKSGSTVISSGNTGSSNCITLSIPAAGSYTVLIHAAGYDDAGYTRSLACGGTTTVSFTSVDVNYVCCQSKVPIPMTVFLTICGVTVTLAYDIPSGFWLGGACGLPATTSLTPVLTGCTPLPPAAGTTELTAQFQCSDLNVATNTINFRNFGIATINYLGTSVLWDCGGDVVCQGSDVSTGTFPATGTLYPLSVTGTSPVTSFGGVTFPCPGASFVVTG